VDDLKQKLNEADAILRSKLEAARTHGELCVKDLNLNGARDQLPSGKASAIDEVRGLYAQANDAGERVLIEHFGSNSEKVQAIVDQAGETP
jgi:hypothetical protein